MSKQQQSRGRANRRYQARKRDFRRCEIPRAWSKAHKGYAATLPRRGDITIAEEIESYSDDISFRAEMGIGPGLSGLPKTEETLRRERTYEDRAEKAYQRAMYRRTLRYREEREARQQAHLTEYGEGMRTWKDYDWEPYSS